MVKSWAPGHHLERLGHLLGKGQLHVSEVLPPFGHRPSALPQARNSSQASTDRGSAFPSLFTLRFEFRHFHMS